MKVIITALMLLTITTNALAVSRLQNTQYDTPELCEAHIKDLRDMIVEKGYVCRTHRAEGISDYYSCSGEGEVLAILCEGSLYILMGMTAEEAKRIMP